MSLNKLLLSVFMVFVFWSCASYQPQYQRDVANFDAVGPAEDSLTYRLYLVGDAGNAEMDKTPAVLAYLRSELSKTTQDGGVVFLGDNIYPSGMPPKKSEDRPLAEHRLRVQADVARDFDGRVLFIPGNHDWYKYGMKGLDRQKDFLEKELGADKIWAPRIGCGGPKEIKINEQLVLVVIDSQWWLENWNKHPGINEGCDVTNRVEFLRAFEGAIKGNKDRNVVVMMHHPMENYGRHGGNFAFRDHLLPIPVLGSLMPIYRSNIGTKQDGIHPAFQELYQSIKEIVRLNGNVTFVSGHDHTLQYIERYGQQFIISGSASKKAPAGRGDGSLFAYGGKGYACLDLYKDGSLWVSFFKVNDAGDAKELMFRHQVKPALYETMEGKDLSNEVNPSIHTTVKRRLLNESYERGAFGRFILGDHYRSTFSLSSELPILDLSTYQGGVKPIKQGGGNQTHSLRLEADNGKQYSMRSLEKDPSATVGYQLSQSKSVRELLADAFTAAHPLSALPIPILASAAGVNHTNPEVYFVPRQPSLGRFNDGFGDATYLVEERADDDLWRDDPSFGKPEDIISTPDVIEKMHKHQDHVLDKAAMARARAFDLLLGDWDRHDDQWRWAVHKKDGWTYYRPIPRDRDQAFAHYDGLMLGLGRMMAPDLRPLAPFTPNPRRVYWTTHGARFFDVTFLSGIDRATWEAEARHIQATLTDEVIEKAFKEGWPPEVYELDAEKVIGTLKQRRDNLVDIVTQLYEFRAREVEVVGTNKKDRFEFDVQPGGNVKVSIFDSNGDGERDADRPFYERLFLADETNELIVYGLENDDFFVFSGNEQPKMKIRLVGGEGKDEIMQGEDAPQRLRRVVYYDYLQKNEKTKWNGVKGVVDRRSPNPTLNTYSRRSQDRNYNYFSILPNIAGDPDNGLLLGVNLGLTHYGFKKAPFAGQHQLSFQYAANTSGGEAMYRGEFTDVFGSRELVLDALWRNDLYAVNFYGLGNETVNTEEDNGTNYHRVRQRAYSFSPQLLSRPNRATEFYIGPEYLSIETQATDDRFITDTRDDLAPETFETQHYLRLNSRLNIDTRNSAAIPTRGMQVSIAGGYNLTLSEVGSDFFYLNAALAASQKIDFKGNLVIANRVGFGRIFTDDFFYFQAVTLGGFGPNANFRGFRRERFSGNTAFYLNNDLRWRFINSKSANLPLSLGVLAGFDYGRVWLTDEDSKKWHRSFGGGLWVSPFDIMTMQLSYFVGDDDKGRMSFTTGFFF